MKPFARVDLLNANGPSDAERMNSEGFRGPERLIPKPRNTFRILAIGDSVVQGFSVAYRDTWENVLEGDLNAHAAAARPTRHFEVMNAGIGGYVSWQALVRMEDRGLKYEPDMVLVLVGWNDMVYSALPFWRPGIDLSEIERFRADAPGEDDHTALARLRLLAFNYSYVARLIRAARNNIWNRRRIAESIRKHQHGSDTPFNEEALRLYLHNLEQIYRAISSRGMRMALIAWPTVLTPQLLHNAQVHERMVLFYDSFPLSTGEVLQWHGRYTDAERTFASDHPDVLLVDAVRAFDVQGEERLRWFTDHAHLTIDGNQLMGHTVSSVLMQAGTTRF